MDEHAQTSHTHPDDRIAWAFGVTAVIFAAEALGGYLAQSLALLADAGHMLVDLLALGLAWAASRAALKPADSRRTWGYRRVEVLGALINCLLLLGVSLAVVFEAWGRLWSPEPIDTSLMLGIGLLGLLGNGVSLLLLRHHHGHLGVQAAMWHIFGDALSSVGVVVAAGLIAWSHYVIIDPLLSVALSAVIGVGAVNLGREVFEVLLESAPKGMNTQAVREAMQAVEGVVAVHDLHVWSITSGLHALSAHIVHDLDSTDPQKVRLAVEALLKTRFEITHTTLQLEQNGTESCGC